MLMKGVVAVMVAISIVGAACSSPDKSSPDDGSLATFSERGFSFRYPKTWKVEESFEVTPQDWACANDSWYVTLSTPGKGRVSMHRCIFLGLGRTDTDPEALKASMAPIDGTEGSTTISKEGNVTRVEFEGTYDASAAEYLEVAGTGRVHFASVVPPAANVLYTVTCVFPEESKREFEDCTALIDSLQIPEAGDPVPDYITNGLTRFQYEVGFLGTRGATGLTARVTYRDHTGTEVEDVVPLPWRSELMAAPESVEVALRVGELNGSDSARVQCSITTDQDFAGWQSGVGAGKTCEIPPTTLAAMGSDAPFPGMSPSSSGTPSPSVVLEGEANMVMSGDRHATFARMPVASMPAILGTDEVHLMWLDDTGSLELHLVPARVGTLESTPITFPESQPTSYLSPGTSPKNTTVLQPEKGECTITIRGLTEEGVSGSFRCPDLGLAFPTRTAKRVALTGTFEAHVPAG